MQAQRGTLRNVFGSTRGYEGLVAGHHVTLLKDGEESFPAMLSAIAAAEREVLLEMYWFGSDATGWRFAHALADRAREGLRVVVVYDAIGSLEADPAMWAFLRDAGCTVHEYHPIAPWRRRFRIGVVNRRNHRKMLVIDEQVGFTGGINLGDPWAPMSEGGQGWRDEMVRIEGPEVAHMRTIFFHGLRSLHGRPMPLKATALETQRGDHPEGTSVRVLANHYFGQRRAIRAAYLERIRAARRSVFITNSYFVPDNNIRRALAQAARRGVEVRVIVPGENDVAAVRHASRKMYGWFHARNVHIHEFQEVILHAKTAVVDEEWAVIGTYNLDYRSFRFNLEVAVAVEDARIGALCAQRFREDLESAPPVDWQAYRYRSLGDRLFENFFHLFRKLL